MHSLRFLAMFLILAASVPAQEAPPDWSKKTFSAAPDQVFAAALKSIAAQHHEVKSKDEANGVVKFHVGVTAWSWGYTMVLKVVPGENNTSNVSVDIARSGGKTFSWGSGKKEVDKIFKGIDRELSKQPAQEAKAPAATQAPPSTPAMAPTPAAVPSEPSQETVKGVTNFHRLGTTVACAGATKPEAVSEIKKLGYASIINLRQASESGANVEAEAAAAEAAGIRYYHIPFNPGAPDAAAADKFLDAITTSGSEPAFIHCAGGVRASTMWFIKRLVVDHWEMDRAEKEAAALGMTNPALKQFAIDYAQTHKR